MSCFSQRESCRATAGISSVLLLCDFIFPSRKTTALTYVRVVFLVAQANVYEGSLSVGVYSVSLQVCILWLFQRFHIDTDSLRFRCFLFCFVFLAAAVSKLKPVPAPSPAEKGVTGPEVGSYIKISRAATLAS